jgi:hypothetical protein
MPHRDPPPAEDLLAMTSAEREELRVWATEALLAGYDALDAPLRSAAKIVRNATAPSSG